MNFVRFIRCALLLLLHCLQIYIPTVQNNLTEFHWLFFFSCLPCYLLFFILTFTTSEKSSPKQFSGAVVLPTLISFHSKLFFYLSIRLKVCGIRSYKFNIVDSQCAMYACNRTLINFYLASNIFIFLSLELVDQQYRVSLIFINNLQQTERNEEKNLLFRKMGISDQFVLEPGLKPNLY